MEQKMGSSDHFDKERQTEHFIINESEEVALGEDETWTEKIVNAFPAFSHRNYQLYFFGQLISLTGTWIQIVAQGWLVYELTKSAFMVGFVTAIGMFPVLIFTLIGGVIVDRFPKKNLLLITQTIPMIVAFLLGYLTLSGHITIPLIAFLAFLIGISDALDKPARQAFIIELVGKASLPSAIALNAGLFNSARAIGPAVAGIVIALYGTGWAFILNAISYIFVIIALYFMKPTSLIPRVHPHPIVAIKQGLTYAFSHSVIKKLLFFTTVSAIFGWSYATLIPVAVGSIFHQGATSLGYFYVSSGIGALVATVLVSAYARKTNPLVFIVGGNMLFVFSIIAFSFTTTVQAAVPFLFLTGIGLVAQFSTINSIIQHLVENNIRGRVMSIYVLMFMGMLPFGSFLMGAIAQQFGVPFAIQFGAIIVLLHGMYIFMNHVQIYSEYKKHLALS